MNTTHTHARTHTHTRMYTYSYKNERKQLPARRRSPLAVTLSKKAGSAMMSNTVQAARHTKGLPAKVEPWSPAQYIGGIGMIVGTCKPEYYCKMHGGLPGVRRVPMATHHAQSTCRNCTDRLQVQRDSVCGRAAQAIELSLAE